MKAEADHPIEKSIGDLAPGESRRAVFEVPDWWQYDYGWTRAGVYIISRGLQGQLIRQFWDARLGEWFLRIARSTVARSRHPKRALAGTDAMRSLGRSQREGDSRPRPRRGWLELPGSASRVLGVRGPSSELRSSDSGRQRPPKRRRGVD
jgi:hypothetical protein